MATIFVLMIMLSIALLPLWLLWQLLNTESWGFNLIIALFVIGVIGFCATLP